MFFYKLLLKWIKNEKKIWVQQIIWSSKILFCFWIEAYFFFNWSYSQSCFDVAQRRENRRWKWQRLFDIVQRCSIQHSKTQRCFNVVQCCKYQGWRTQRCFNIDLTLCDVATSYQPKSNAEPTLKCLLGFLLARVIHFNGNHCA